MFPNFQNCAGCEKYWRDNKHDRLLLGYLSLDIICSSKLTVFLKLTSRKTVRFWERIMSADKYPSIFSRQMGAIVYLTTGSLTNTLRSSQSAKTFRLYTVALRCVLTGISTGLATNFFSALLQFQFNFTNMSVHR